MVCGGRPTAIGVVVPLLRSAGYEVTLLSERTALPNDAVVRRLGVETLPLTGLGCRQWGTPEAADAVAQADLLLTDTTREEWPGMLSSLVGGLKLRWQRGEASPLVLCCEGGPGPHKRLKVELQDALGREGQEAVEGMTTVQCLLEGRAVETADGWVAEADGALLVDGETLADWQGTPVTPVRPFALALERYILLERTGERLAAHLGVAAGCRTLSQTLENDKAAAILMKALAEACRALAAKHGLVPEDGALWAERWAARYREPAFDWECAALCRDPLDLIDRNGPLVQAIHLSLKQKGKPVYLSAALAAVFLWDDADDPSSQRMREFIRKKGIGKALDKLCGLGIRTQPHWWAVEFYKAFRAGALTRN